MINGNKGSAKGVRRKGREKAFQILYGFSFVGGMRPFSMIRSFQASVETVKGGDEGLASLPETAVFAWELAETDWKIEMGRADEDLNPDKEIHRILQNPRFEGARRIDLTVRRHAVASPDLPQEAVDFAWDLVSGAWQRREELDAVVARFSQHWKLERIARVELSILRLALFEMLHMPDIPLKVAINEAVELAKVFGDENSRNFVNGILDAVARAVDSGEFGVRKGI